MLLKAKRGDSSSRQAFALLEALVVAGVVAALGLGWLLFATRARTRAQAETCLRNTRQLALAWSLYANDNADRLVCAQGNLPNRTNWCGGKLDFDPANAHNWDSALDLARSPLWPYAGKSASVFQCPADHSVVAGKARVRSYSMSQVFGSGDHLDGVVADSAQSKWKTYSNLRTIAQPAKTWVFLDEHPNTLGDGAFANVCTGAGIAGQSRILDYPAHPHQGGTGFSFADGHAVLHRWMGPLLGNAPVSFSSARELPQATATAPADVADVYWLAENSTVANERSYGSLRGERHESPPP